MSYAELDMLIDGKWTKGNGAPMDVLNPATEEVLGQLPTATDADLDAAVEASQRGFDAWSDMTALARQKIMEKAARYIEDNVDQIARDCTLEQGKPFIESKMELGFVIDAIRWYGEEGKRAYGRLIPSRFPGTRLIATKEPVGPTCAFVAWNFPGVNVIRKIAGALGAGCSIVLKPSEETPSTAIAIARAFQEAGVPDGTVNIVFGDPAAVSSRILASDIPRKMSFTGSTAVGKLLARQAAETLKRCTMELGGHAPVLVFDDADIGAAAKAAAATKFRNAGQVCISPTRFYVQEKSYGDFVDAFEEAVKSVKVGNGMEEGTQMGPLVADRRLPVMQDFVDDAVAQGATLVAGGKRIGNQGYFYEPTLLKDVPENAKIMNEEPFGPVAPVASFKSEDEIIAKANKVKVGLASYAFTSDGERANRLTKKLNAGMVGINSMNVSTPESPFGGVDESGYGSEGGSEGLDAYLRTKLVSETGV